MAEQTKSVRKLEKLRQNRILKLEEKLDKDIRGYDHLIQYKDDHTASLRSDWVDENIRIIIIKHNYEVKKAKKMSIFRDFLARSEGFEPSTLGLENRCSIQLS